MIEPDGDQWMLSRAGSALKLQKALKRIERKRADEIVAKVIAATKEINRDTDLPSFIDKITVFGSYLSDRPDLGDIDLVVKCALRKPPPEINFEDWDLDYAREHAPPSTLRSFMATLFFAEHTALRRLTKISRHISLHSPIDLKLEGVQSKVIFTADEAIERYVAPSNSNL